jgi:aerobic-type carbon monoxide dehydrogenase small subunit (CoxS/CutS family)
MSASPDDPRRRADGLSRRSFLKGAGGVAAAGSVLASEAGAEPAQAAPEAVRTLAGEVAIELRINGAPRKVSVEPRTTLLSVLRHRVDPPLTGSKEVCDRGDCGACTVMVDGRTSYACLLLAVDMVGKELTTVEGLGSPEQLSPVQDAFCEHDASMCGFCTPGFVVSTTACLQRNPGADLAEIKQQLAGNFCRCGTYPHIFAAALAAGARMRKEGR